MSLVGCAPNHAPYNVPYTLPGVPYKTPYNVPYRSRTVTKVKKTFRVELDIADVIARIASAEGVSETAAVERAVLAYSGGARPDDDAPRQPSADGAAVSALVSQLAEKDAQISRLMDMVAEGTRAVQGAQALHHETAPRLSIESVEQGKGRWARLKEAWRG